jgi:hypothetical protein
MSRRAGIIAGCCLRGEQRPGETRIDVEALALILGLHAPTSPA